jgi:hypothetical protein
VSGEHRGFRRNKLRSRGRVRLYTFDTPHSGVKFLDCEAKFVNSDLKFVSFEVKLISAGMKFLDSRKEFFTVAPRLPRLRKYTL